MKGGQLTRAIMTSLASFQVSAVSQ